MKLWANIGLQGIAMGALYGNVTAQALEDCPEEARGIVSGMLQQGKFQVSKHVYTF